MSMWWLVLMVMCDIPLLILYLNESYSICIAVVSLMMCLRLREVVSR